MYVCNESTQDAGPLALLIKLIVSSISINRLHWTHKFLHSKVDVSMNVHASLNESIVPKFAKGTSIFCR